MPLRVDVISVFLVLTLLMMDLVNHVISGNLRMKWEHPNVQPVDVDDKRQQIEPLVNYVLWVNSPRMMVLVNRVLSINMRIQQAHVNVRSVVLVLKSLERPPSQDVSIVLLVSSLLVPEHVKHVLLVNLQIVQQL